MKHLLLLATLLATLLVPSLVVRAQPAEPTPPPAPPTVELPPGGFVQASGTQLTRLGQPVQLKGVNYYPQGRPWAEMWYEWNAPQTERELRLARDQLGINTVRVLLPYTLATDSEGAGIVTPAIITRLREFTQIAGSLDMRVVVTLFDFYNDFPLPDTKAEQQNIVYLRTLLGNFVGDDRIVAWDLHNEPDHYDMWAKSGQAQQVLLWLSRMADEVHRIAPNHLVTVGMGQYDNLWQPGPDGRRVIDYSDMISIHIYNAADAARQLDELRTHTDKPIVVEEFGWPSGPNCATSAYTEAQQAAMFQTTLEAATGRVAGVLAWSLRDYHAGPTMRWDTREEHYGLFRADDSLKPAALLLRDYQAAPLPSAHQTNLPLTAVDPRLPGGPTAPLFIPESGHYVKGDFRLAWDLFGGRGSFGLPLTEAFVRPSDNRVVQYFEGAVLELNPKAQEDPSYPLLTLEDKVKLRVLVTNTGATFSNGRVFPPQPRGHTDEFFFADTGYTVDPLFRPFFRGVQGAWRLGAPISGLLQEEVNGQPTQVQYFRNGRVEWNPLTQAAEAGRLGIWALDIQCRYAP